MARRLSPAQQEKLTLVGLDHRAVYREIRNYLAGQAVGATRDRALLDELLKVLFSKHYMDISRTLPGGGASDELVASAYRAALSAVAQRVPDVFRGHDQF